MSNLKGPVVLLIVAAILAAVSASLYYLVPSGGSRGPTIHFTIVMSTNGFNGSATHSDRWPVMKVAQGQVVTLHIVNQDPVEPHGLAITHYFVSGVTVTPGKTYDLTFTASQTGSFRVYCSIFCGIHPLMQNGEIIVA